MTHPAFRPLLITALLASPAAFAAEGGLPQMDTSTYASQLFWLFVCFTTLYVLMSRLALPKVTRVLETRRIRMEGDLDDAQALNKEAEKTKAAFEKSLMEAQKTGTAAQIAAERTVGDKIAEEQSRFADNSRKRLTIAEQAINKAKADALHSLSDIAAEIAAEMVSKVADVQVSKADAKKAVQSVMQEG